MIKGMPGLQARLKAIADTEVLMKRVAGEGAREAGRLVPRKTGNLARTIRPLRATADTAEIGAGGTGQVGYAAVVELGSRPHLIRPRRKRALMFSASGAKSQVRLSGSVRSAARRRGGGDIVFTRLVRHPGTRPHPFLAPGLTRAAERMGVGGIVELWNEAD